MFLRQLQILTMKLPLNSKLKNNKVLLRRENWSRRLQSSPLILQDRSANFLKTEQNQEYCFLIYKVNHKFIFVMKKIV